MIRLQFPQPDFRIRKQQEQYFVFDTIRKAWLLLTEEEWVRQNFVSYLVKEKKYPAGAIALEKEIDLNGLKKRFDMLVYNSRHEPWMMVECKAADVALTEKVLQQVLRYNMSVPVEFIVITNGALTMAWQKANNQLQMLNQLPDID